MQLSAISWNLSKCDVLLYQGLCQKYIFLLYQELDTIQVSAISGACQNTAFSYI